MIVNCAAAVLWRLRARTRTRTRTDSYGGHWRTSIKTRFLQRVRAGLISDLLITKAPQEARSARQITHSCPSSRSSARESRRYRSLLFTVRTKRHNATEGRCLPLCSLMIFNDLQIRCRQVFALLYGARLSSTCLICNCVSSAAYCPLLTSLFALIRVWNPMYKYHQLSPPLLRNVSFYNDPVYSHVSLFYPLWK